MVLLTYSRILPSHTVSARGLARSILSTTTSQTSTAFLYGRTRFLRRERLVNQGVVLTERLHADP